MSTNPLTSWVCPLGVLRRELRQGLRILEPGRADQILTQAVGGFPLKTGSQSSQGSKKVIPPLMVLGFCKGQGFVICVLLILWSWWFDFGIRVCPFCFRGSLSFSWLVFVECEASKKQWASLKRSWGGGFRLSPKRPLFLGRRLVSQWF